MKTSETAHVNLRESTLALPLLMERTGGIRLLTPSKPDHAVRGAQRSPGTTAALRALGMIYLALLTLTCTATAQQPAFRPPDSDFGDAPAPYPTLLTANGARHLVLSGFWMGNTADAESNGQPNASASGDDLNPQTGVDDEDGVVFLTLPLRAGTTGQVQVSVSLAGLLDLGKLDAWVDFNGDGDWADPGEQIFTSQNVVAGVNVLNFSVPNGVKSGPSFARFRLSIDGGLSYDGPGDIGEVEDHSVRITGNGRDPCDKTTNGTDFWLAFPGNAFPDDTLPQTLTLCIVGPAGTSGVIDLPGLSKTQNFQIPASGSISTSVPHAMVIESNDTVEPKGVHITTDQEVAVYGENRIDFTTDAFLGLPSDCLGKEYLVLGYGNVWDGFPILNGSEFAIVAIQDETEVTITPSVATGSRAAGVAYQITLNEGDTYQLRNEENGAADLSGTVITSNQRVGVFAGHKCANINGKDAFFCDHVVEHLLPVKAWGTRYVAGPLVTRSGGDTIRVIAATDKTAVVITDKDGTTNVMLDRGEVHEQLVQGGAVVSSVKRVLVAQYSNSAIFDGVDKSDPFMTMLQPENSYLNSYTICSPLTAAYINPPPSGFEINMVNIVTPNASVGTILVDGFVMPAMFYKQIGSTGFSYAQRPLTEGVHTIAGPNPFGITAYGFSEYDSYGYPGSMGFTGPFPPEIICPPEVTITLEDGCEVDLPDLRSQVQ